MGPREDMAYLDSQTAVLAQPMTALALWDAMMARPLPGLGLAFKVRDAVSARFGAERIGGFTGRRAGALSVGDKLDFFLVGGVSDARLVLTARDRHLDVMVSVDTSGDRVWITASVVTHNSFGRAYMIPVGLVYPAIVRGMLRRMRW